MSSSTAPSSIGMEQTARFDPSIAHLTHVPRRHYGRWIASALILAAFALW